MAKKVRVVKSFKANMPVPMNSTFIAADTSTSPPVFYYEVIETRDEEYNDLVPDFVSEQLKSNKDTEK